MRSYPATQTKGNSSLNVSEISLTRHFYPTCLFTDYNVYIYMTRFVACSVGEKKK